MIPYYSSVCTSTVVQLVYTTRYKTKLVYYTQYYTYGCGFWGWESCGGSRTKLDTEVAKCMAACMSACNYY